MNNDIDFLCCTLVGEARGEPIEGIVAVGNVIRNRYHQAKTSYQSVCLEPNQFSCWNGNDLNFFLVHKTLDDLHESKDIQDPYIRQCCAIGRIIDDLRDNTKGCLNYVTIQRYQIALARRDPKLDGWMLRLQEVVRYGHHVFLQ